MVVALLQRPGKQSATEAILEILGGHHLEYRDEIDTAKREVTSDYEYSTFTILYQKLGS